MRMPIYKLSIGLTKSITPPEIGDIDTNGICLHNFTIIINIHLFKPFNYFYIKYQQLLILIININ
jgi:hypothetical protein